LSNGKLREKYQRFLPEPPIYNTEMKKCFFTVLAVTLIFNIAGCSREKEEREIIGEQDTQMQITHEVDEQENVFVTEPEAVRILNELIEKANHANYISAGICEGNVNTIDLAGNTGTGTHENITGAESVEDLEKYFYSVFETETAQKYLYPITTGITIDERTLPLYYDGESGLTLENRALADPLFLGEWKTDNIEIISSEQNVICASVPYTFVYAPDEVHIGELRAVYDETSESWKLDNSYGLSFIGETLYETEEMTDEWEQSKVLEEIFDAVKIAETFLTKNFNEDTDKRYMDFFSVEENGKTLNTDILLEEKPEFYEILSDDDPVQAIKDHFLSCFTPAFASKFSIEDMFSYDAVNGKIYVSEQESIGFLEAIKERYKIASFTEDRIVLLTHEYETGFYDENDAHYRYVYIIKHDGTWKMSESAMVNPVLHVPDMLTSGTDDEMMLSNQIVNEQFGLTLTLPEHWSEIALVDATEHTEESDCAHVFTLREKIAYNELSKGIVWTLLACPVNVELEYMIEGAVTTDGQYLIGSDSNFHYLLTYKEDTYYSDLNSEIAVTGEKQYYRLQNESKAVLSAFLQENEISVNSICPANRCYGPETVQLTEEIVNEYFGFTLMIPEHWNEIAFISAEAEESPTSREVGPVLAFTLYEKIAYTDRIQAGNVWYLQAYPVGTEFEYAIEGVETVNGRLVIGTDDTYMYLIGFPTGVEYLMDDTDVRKLTESQIRYRQLQEESRAVLTNFIEENGITANEYYSIQDIKFRG